MKDNLFDYLVIAGKLDEILSEGEKEDMEDEEIELKRYIIKKGETDLLSSLKALDKKLLKRIKFWQNLRGINCLQYGILINLYLKIISAKTN